MKKLLPYILILIILAGIFSPTNVGFADTVCRPPEVIAPDGNSCMMPENTGYNFLSPLPGQEAFDPTKEGGGDLGRYLGVMINLFIAICAVLAVIMIIIGGLEYMTNELISNKEEGKKKILGAIFGLVLALGAYTILYTINPQLLDTSLSSLDKITVAVTLNELSDGSYSSTGGAGMGGGGNCTVQTNPSNACSPTKLASSCFGNKADEASKICNLESGGGQTNVKSGSDLLNNGSGPSYSVGLWQINLTVHQIGGLNCPAAFSGPCGRGTATPSNSGPFVGGPKVGNCSQRVINQELYNSCVTAAQNPNNSTAVACKLYNSSSFKPWTYSANKCSVPI